MIQKFVIAFIWSIGALFLLWTLLHDGIGLETIEELLWFCLSATTIVIAAPQLNSKPLFYGWSFYCLGLLLDVLDGYFEFALVPILLLDTSLKSIGFILVCYGMLLLLASKKATIAKLNLEIAAKQQLEEKLRYDAHHDPLTKLGNRKACFDRFAQLSEQYSWLYYFDLDNFKHANDEYGHHVGDNVLTLFANALTAHFQHDTVFRLGGDEFVAFSNEGPEQLTDLRTNLTTPLKQYQVDTSIGATKTDAKQAPDKILCQADAKMYRDKSRH
ncbi:GGDEF domain-containing protein [Pseudoalteromonas sp. JBTF-M23]|uniref:diguanylate cyclase n=1 Tax=Pseudoalteromonas caenipelagi TaxID=2726988 RepID=A0A849VEA2_9GAMM|nr:GGDEF domain-containing protein [Pseudoalteromonas caenipelagi]NOU50031.1 GGDEF domain-containing protein [Pseudoalteromonas caenipelagi]